jgi:5-oxoprolinase (ATP-hydrolysing) subunit A
MKIDLNCDLGERHDVPEERILPFVTSANIACGGHAGDENTMERTLRLARRYGVMCGAHPGYPDRAGFGRAEMHTPTAAVADTVYEQVTRLAGVADRLGVTLTHVKPHGALYNLAARDPDTARAVAQGVARWRRDVTLVALAGAPMPDAGLPVVAEGFADRAYEPDGSLRSRKLPGAVIEDERLAAEQAIKLAREGRVQTICIHGDNPAAPRIACAVRAALRGAGVDVRPLVALPEPWMRGQLSGVDPLLAPVLYTFMHAREELAQHTSDLTADQLQARPNGAASVAFHIRHIAGSTDRLMTYAEGRQLTEAQMASLKAEAQANGTREELLAAVDEAFDRAERVVRGFSIEQLRQPREIGRKRLPTTVHGLLVHVAEHTMRHVGQAVTTVKVVSHS